MALTAVTSKSDICLAILEAFGIDSTNVRSYRIECQMDEAMTIVVERYVDAGTDNGTKLIKDISNAFNAAYEREDYEEAAVLRSEWEDQHAESAPIQRECYAMQRVQ